MSGLAVTLLLFGTLVVILVLGTPFAFALGATAVLFAWLLWGPGSLNMVAITTLGTMLTTLFLAVPLFILMGNFLQRSGIADDLYGLMYSLLGRIRGGLAVGTIVICTMFAAMAGISGAATVTMGVVALPSMLKRNYDKRMAMGSISAGGALGILIPPSVTMILYGVMATVSVGKLFAGGLLPGLLLSTLFIIYILIRSRLNPEMGPALPPEERVPLRAVLSQLRAVVLPVLLIIAVLGSIFSGIATPTEAAAVGAFGAIMATGIHRKLSWRLVQECSTETLRLTCMVIWIAVCAIWLSSVYTATGGPEFVNQVVQSLEVNRWLIIIGMQAILFGLGMMMDPAGIIFITVPIFIPIITMLGFDPVWFGILFVMNMEMAYLTPPFGFNLFYMKAIAPKGITMVDIYRSVIPFVLLQLIGLIVVMIFPKIATLLPSLLFG